MPRLLSRALSRADTALLLDRHRNPFGIASRIVVYPAMGIAAWRHRVPVLLAGMGWEAMLWTVVPPARHTLPVVETAIQQELRWLNAPPGRAKTLSFVVLAAFPVVLFAGLWRHSRTLLAAALALLLGFQVLMQRLGRN